MIVERCKLQAVKFKSPRLVQLATGAKRRVLSEVSNCPLKIASQPIIADMNVLHLGSYGILIGMDWLEKHWSLINCKTKTIGFQNEVGVRQEIQGVQKPL